MRKALLLLSFFGATLPAAKAQTGYQEELDINNIRIVHLLNGDMWWYPDVAGLSCEFPKGSGRNYTSNGALWIGGYDAQNNLHVAAQTYRQNGNDYWPGPSDTSTLTINKALHRNKWSRIWKINRSQIDSFRQLTTHTVANTPVPILEWPAKGNPYAKGRNSIYALTITADMAPFVDVNSDGQYNPLDGDYPAMKGDQMLWWIINDINNPHANSQGRPIGLEIRNTAYAFKRNTTADNIIFYEFDLTNKDTASYHGLRFGFASDIDLGYAFDDYAGFDSSRRMGVYYNGNNSASEPVIGVTMLQLPGDNGSSYVPAGSFMAWNNDNSPNGNPNTDVEYSNLLHSTNRGGVPLPNNGRYMLGKRTECDSNFVPGDRRMVIASNDMSLPAGASAKVAMALVISATGGGCPNLDFTGVNEVADTAWKIYRGNAAGIREVAARKTLRIFPNPVQSVLTVETGDAGNGAVVVYDALGRPMPVPVRRSGNKLELQTASLVPGIYTILYRGMEATQTNVFVKE